MSNQNSKWKNYLVELLVILFGILLAFQLDRCDEESSKQKLVKDHLEYLQEELRFIYEMYKRVLSLQNPI